MNLIDIKKVRKFTLAAGLSSLFGTISQLEFMIVGNTGLLGDHISVVTAILILPLLNTLGNISITNQKSLGRFVQILGVLGTLINFVGGIINVLALRGFIEFEHQASWIMVGSSLIGIAIFIFMVQNRDIPQIKITYFWFSLLFGAGMTMSFLGLIYRDELNAIMQATQSISDSSMGLKLLLFFSGTIVILGHPIWVLWSWRRLFQNQGDFNG